MNEISKILLSKAAVNFLGTIGFSPERVTTLSGKKGHSIPAPPQKTTIKIAIDELKNRYSISDDEALIIRKVCEEKESDLSIITNIKNNQNRPFYLEADVKPQIKVLIKESYKKLNHINELGEDKYIDDGGIFDMMTYTILTNVLATIQNV
jgi:type I restriction enzyme R subunit